MKTRNSIFEVLRIIAMMLILLSHFAFHGGTKSVGGIENIDNPINRTILRVFCTGNFGNTIFILLTGYFLCKSLSVNYKRLLDIVVQVFTYSLGCYIVHQLFIPTQFHIEELFNAITPLIHGTYWFFTTYTLIYIFHPYINVLINNLGKVGLQRLIITTFIVWSFLPLAFDVSLERSNFIFFCMTYCLGAYFRLYPAKWWNKNIWKIIIYSTIIWIIVSTPFFENTNIHNRLYGNGSPLIFAFCGSIFLLCISKEVCYSKNINLIGSCMGGVYLLHENPYVRSLLYTKIFNLERYAESVCLPLVILCCVIITFIVGVLLEYVRKQAWEWVNPVFYKFISRISRLPICTNETQHRHH